MNKECPKTPKCPLFNNNLLKRQASADLYKTLFCLGGEEKFQSCMRYKVSEKYGKCADFVMPNSSYSMEEIEEKMKNQGLLV